MTCIGCHPSPTTPPKDMGVGLVHFVNKTSNVERLCLGGSSDLAAAATDLPGLTRHQHTTATLVEWRC